MRTAAPINTASTNGHKPSSLLEEIVSGGDISFQPNSNDPLVNLETALQMPRMSAVQLKQCIEEALTPLREKGVRIDTHPQVMESISNLIGCADNALHNSSGRFKHPDIRRLAQSILDCMAQTSSDIHQSKSGDVVSHDSDLTILAYPGTETPVYTNTHEGLEDAQNDLEEAYQEQIQELQAEHQLEVRALTNDKENLEIRLSALTQELERLKADMQKEITSKSPRRSPANSDLKVKRLQREINTLKASRDEREAHFAAMMKEQREVFQATLSESKDKIAILQEQITALNSDVERLAHLRDEAVKKASNLQNSGTEDIARERPYVDYARRTLAEARQVKHLLCEALDVPFDDHVPLSLLKENVRRLREEVGNDSKGIQKENPRLRTPSEELTPPEVSEESATLDDTPGQIVQKLIDQACRISGFLTLRAEGIHPDREECTHIVEDLIRTSDGSAKHISILLSAHLVSLAEYRGSLATRFLESHLCEFAKSNKDIFKEAVDLVWKLDRVRGALVKFCNMSPPPPLAEHFWDAKDYLEIRNAEMLPKQFFAGQDMRSLLR